VSQYDLVILNGTVVVPEVGGIRMDVGVKNGVICAMADALRASDGEDVIDAKGLHVLPGAVDSHFHIGIYRPLSEDAQSESRSAISGGVTSILSYFRTGHHYLNKVGPYREIFPEVLELSRNRFWCDYGYHIAPMTTAQLDEIDWLVDQGVASFKFYMFYKGLTLSADSTAGKQYAMSDEYDLGHAYELMVRIAEAAAKRTTRISLSLHCENPELIRVFIARIKKSKYEGLEAYSRARPGLSERLSIEEAGVLAQSTFCPVNLLHLSGSEAVESAIALRRRNPKIDMILETTLHHLMLNYEDVRGLQAKVNPPIRSKQDCAAVWEALMAGQIDTVVSDHACCLEELKRDDLWTAMPGFGGTALLYPVLLSEGVRKRRLSLARAVALVSTNPARHYGMYPRKGAIAVGSDADFAICDMNKTQTIAAANLHSAQPFSPFDGMTLTGWPVTTVVRGKIVFRNGETIDKPYGQFIRRPIAVQTTAANSTGN